MIIKKWESERNVVDPCLFLGAEAPGKDYSDPASQEIFISSTSGTLSHSLICLSIGSPNGTGNGKGHAIKGVCILELPNQPSHKRVGLDSRRECHFP